MKTKFSQNANFKDLLKRNQNAIVDAALNGLEATDNFKLMQSLIKAMCDKHPDNSFKYIVISEEDFPFNPIFTEEPETSKRPLAPIVKATG
jgi:hypothetical protein